jgi:aldose 1-epimerase
VHPDPTPLSGEQYELTLGKYTASIASVGATLRRLTFEGRDLVVPFEADVVRPNFRGATLAPWPNRIVDGRYEFAGTEHQVALTEPERSNALHGLVAWTAFAATASSPSSVTLATTIEAQTGYPFRVEVLVEYSLDEDGLHETVTAHNTGPDAAPWGTGPHPYLVAGLGAVDDWSLELPARSYLEVTEDRLVPVGMVATSATAFDFTDARRIGDTFIDHAFTGFTENRARLIAADGHGVQMTWDAACPWVQVHTADRPMPEPSRRGLAVEPMTCPPDAFNSGIDLVVLAPGHSASASWTISAL